jgi:hypothetical protein
MILLGQNINTQQIYDLAMVYGKPDTLGTNIFVWNRWVIRLCRLNFQDIGIWSNMGCSNLTEFSFIQGLVKSSKSCLNQTPNKAEYCLNQTLNKGESCLNQTLNKAEYCLNQTLNKAEYCLNQLQKKAEPCLNQHIQGLV